MRLTITPRGQQRGLLLIAELVAAAARAETPVMPSASATTGAATPVGAHGEPSSAAAAVPDHAIARSVPAVDATIDELESALDALDLALST